ncbi:MAG: hypothetical protein NT099_06275 [Candidatus Saganbacteria bacterium]|nr:hypothetical protein [Candidatus Saganbacteria bacterium]
MKKQYEKPGMADLEVGVSFLEHCTSVGTSNATVCDNGYQAGGSGCDCGGAPAVGSQTAPSAPGDCESCGP